MPVFNALFFTTESCEIMKILQNVPLHDKNWFLTGGDARYFCEPLDERDFQEALMFAKDKQLDIVFLGEGANVLISDEGIDGLVVRPMNVSITHDHEGHLFVGAGAKMQDVIDYALDHCLVGLEEFSGIPGTLGGSVFINIHYFDVLLSDFFVSGKVINRATGVITEVNKEWFAFGYDTSTLHDMNHYLVSAVLKVPQTDTLGAAYAKGRRDEIIRHRNRRYPTSRTCGSFFRNFFPEEVPFLVNGEKLPYVGYYLDKIGVKGALSIGKAGVSFRHANMIVSQPGATTADVVAVARRMQELVFETYGIIPQAECRMLGFSENPLQKPL